MRCLRIRGFITSLKRAMIPEASNGKQAALFESYLSQNSNCLGSGNRLFSTHYLALYTHRQGHGYQQQSGKYDIDAA